jgi:hypothetical protein
MQKIIGNVRNASQTKTSRRNKKMQKRIVVVLVLLALFLASRGAMGIVSTESRVASAKPALAALEFSDITSLAGPVSEHLNGPVCVPGDPCGPQRPSMPAILNGPVCLPGDPCGPQRPLDWADMHGPMSVLATPLGQQVKPDRGSD